MATPISNTKFVCADENLQVGPDGRLRLAPWSVPRLVANKVIESVGDGPIEKAWTTLPGKLMMNGDLAWANDTPIEQQLLIRVTRGLREIVTPNPNAIQMRDRWTTAINTTPDEPLPTGVYNSQLGVAIDKGTTSVTEPNIGLMRLYWGTGTVDEWFGTVRPRDVFRLRYQQYVWTPPPFSENANGTNPIHQAHSHDTRIQLIVFPQQGELVRG